MTLLPSETPQHCVFVGFFFHLICDQLVCHDVGEEEAEGQDHYHEVRDYCRHGVGESERGRQSWIEIVSVLVGLPEVWVGQELLDAILSPKLVVVVLPLAVSAFHNGCQCIILRLDLSDVMLDQPKY